MKTTIPLKWIGLIAILSAATLQAEEPGALTLEQARQQALKMHPSITIAELRALAAKQVTIEARAGFFPSLSANATAVGVGEEVTRLSAGNLNDSQTYDHVGAGVVFSQLITDFGRTANLTEAAKLHARSAEANVATARARLLLAVDASYFAALEAGALKTVAAKTLAARQLLFDRVSALAKNQLKSELDVRFAQVGVGEARLLVDKAEGDWQSALASLGNLLGQRTAVVAALVEVPAPAGALPVAAEPLADLALRQRPELVRLESERDAAQRAARAAGDARLPTISALASAGVVPVGSVQHFEHDYAAAGVNVNLPLFTGGLYRAKQREAELQAQDAAASLQELENDILRDVRLAWLEAGHAAQRVALSATLLENASAALDLAHARFDQGLSSIVELNQAELAQLDAEIAHTNAQYDYQVRRDILDFQTGSLR